MLIWLKGPPKYWTSLPLPPPLCQWMSVSIRNDRCMVDRSGWRVERRGISPELISLSETQPQNCDIGKAGRLLLAPSGDHHVRTTHNDHYTNAAGGYEYNAIWSHFLVVVFLQGRQRTWAGGWTKDEFCLQMWGISGIQLLALQIVNRATILLFVGMIVLFLLVF